MPKKKKTIIVILLIICTGYFIGYNVFVKENTNTSYALSKYGSNSEEVKQIQTKLKRWGYYSGNIDGIYGSKTLAAVKWFQSANGLTVDGIAGEKTLAAMGITSSTTQKNSGVSKNTTDLNLLSRLVYAEARGESYTRTSSSCSCSIK